MLPQKAHYYFTQASIPRALPAAEVQAKAAAKGLAGDAFPSVSEAYQCAKNNAAPHTDLVYVGGSTFVVADFLSFLSPAQEG